MNEQQAAGIIERLERIEHLLGTLIDALSNDGQDDGEDEPQHSLDGQQMPGARDQTQSLG